jgi:UDP-N-acetylmuramoyl-L-alanyl-D-glutamate--2,6-diaminopimelate ligase
MKFTDLIAPLSDVLVCKHAANPEVLRVAQDSRQVQPGDLFVARAGTKASGASFAADAIKAGAVAIVAAEAISVPAGVAFAQVQNANAALALLAHQIQGNPTRSMKMIAVTGTKGKTTVAYLLRSVIKFAGKKVGMIGTVEIDDGNSVVPAEMTTPGPTELVDLFARMKQNGVEYCVMEVSSHALHQHRVAGIDFAVAIFTNLTGDHLDYHKTMEEYAAAKAMLFEGLKPDAVAVVNVDDKWCERIVRGCKGKVIPYFIGPVPPEGGWAGRIDSMTGSGMHLTVFSKSLIQSSASMLRPVMEEHWKKLGIAIKTPLVGRHNVYNLLAMVAAADALAIDIWVAGCAAMNCPGAPGRLQRVDSNRTDISVFVDYAHTHDALENVLRTLAAVMDSEVQLEAATLRRAQAIVDDPDIPPKGKENARRATLRKYMRGRVICLFGCGGDRDRTKRPKMAKVAETLADFVIVTSDNPRTEDPLAIIDEICTGFSPDWKSSGKITVEPDRRRAIQQAIARAQPGDVVLIAGKGHENYQIIGTTKHHFDDVEEATAALKTVSGVGLPRV